MYNKRRTAGPYELIIFLLYLCFYVGDALRWTITGRRMARSFLFVVFILKIQQYIKYPIMGI